MKLFSSVKTWLIVWVWNHTPTCAEMTRLASRSLDKPLTLKERIKTRLHFLICVWCQRYFAHLKQVRHAASRLDEKNHVASSKKLTPDARERMKKALSARGD